MISGLQTEVKVMYHFNLFNILRFKKRSNTICHLIFGLLPINIVPSKKHEMKIDFKCKICLFLLHFAPKPGIHLAIKEI